MSEKHGHWHGVAVEREDPNDDTSELIYDIMHTQHCRWSTTFHPRRVTTSGTVLSEAWWQQEYMCDIGCEVEQNGFDLMPQEPGFYWMRLVFVTHPGGPWGPTEYDVERTWHMVERPSADIVPTVLVD